MQGGGTHCCLRVACVGCEVERFHRCKVDLVIPKLARALHKVKVAVEIVGISCLSKLWMCANGLMSDPTDSVDVRRPANSQIVKRSPLDAERDPSG